MWTSYASNKRLMLRTCQATGWSSSIDLNVFGKDQYGNTQNSSQNVQECLSWTIRQRGRLAFAGRRPSRAATVTTSPDETPGSKVAEQLKFKEKRQSYIKDYKKSEIARKRRSTLRYNKYNLYDSKRKDKPDYQLQLLDSQVTLSDTVV